MFSCVCQLFIKEFYDDDDDNDDADDADIRNEDGLTWYDAEGSSWSRATFTLHLRRRYFYYVVHLVLPYCLFCVIAVFTFVLQPSRVERLNLDTAGEVAPCSN